MEAANTTVLTTAGEIQNIDTEDPKSTKQSDTPKALDIQITGYTPTEKNDDAPKSPSIDLGILTINLSVSTPWTPASPKKTTERTSKSPSQNSNDPATESTPTKIRFCLLCARILTFCHKSAFTGPFLVIPYYVPSTPEHGWTVTDLSIIFGIYNFGVILSSQICMIAQCSPSSRNTILFIGHLMQFVMGIIGFTIMSSMFGSNLPLFYAAAFMVGFSSNTTTMEPYGALISDDEKIQSKVLGAIGKVALLQGIVNAFVTPPIYESFGFTIFCGFSGLFQVLGVVTLCILWCLLPGGHSQTEETADSAMKCDTSGAGRAASIRTPELLSPKSSKTVSTMMEQVQQNDLSATFSAVSSLISMATARSLSRAQSKAMSMEKEQSHQSDLHPNDIDKMEEDSISFWKRLSPSMYVLFFVCTLDSICGEMYGIVYPVVFEEDFGISATVGGYLEALGSVFTYLVLTIVLKYTSRSALCRYPYTLLIVSALNVMAYVCYFVLYEQWIAYSVHWIIRRLHILFMGVELISRVYLSPPSAFNRIASIVGMLRSAGYLIGSSLGPILMTISLKLPFWFMAIVNLIIFMVIAVVFIYRRRYLLGLEFEDENVKEQYLLMEKAICTQSGAAAGRGHSKHENL